MDAALRCLNLFNRIPAHSSRFLAAAPFSLQPSSSYSMLKYSARNTRRKYDTPLLTVALTTLTHPNQRGSMSVVSSAAASQPQERCLPPARRELEAPRLRGLTAPSSAQGGGRTELCLHKQMSTEGKEAWKAPGTNLHFASRSVYSRLEILA